MSSLPDFMIRSMSRTYASGQGSGLDNQDGRRHDHKVRGIVPMEEPSGLFRDVFVCQYGSGC